MDRKKMGDDAERAAAEYLLDRGLKFIAQNARYRLGELDLIMRDGQEIVFIEVRQRNTQRFGGAAASVDFIKQRKLIRAAALWLQRNPRFANSPCRFDLVAIDSQSEPAVFIWYKDAFRPD